MNGRNGRNGLDASHAGVSGGVYAVEVDTGITGAGEGLCWLFAAEAHAAAAARVLEERYGDGQAWHTFQPVADSLTDRDVREYLRNLVGCTDHRLGVLLDAAALA